jgi:chaperonin cofactor prefoldin
VPAEEMHALLAEVESLRRKLAAVTHQRDVYMAELEEALKTGISIPPTEEEMAEAAANDNTHEIDAIIVRLRSQTGGTGGSR